MASLPGRFPTACTQPWGGSDCAGECFALCSRPACVDELTAATYSECRVQCAAVEDAAAAAETCPACETVCHPPPEGTASVLCEHPACEWLCLPGPDCGILARCDGVSCAAAAQSPPLVAALAAPSGGEAQGGDAGAKPRVTLPVVIFGVLLCLLVVAAVVTTHGKMERRKGGEF